MTGEIFRFQIPSWALIILIFLSSNHDAHLVSWVNPPSPGPANWMVGEQQKLLWESEKLYSFKTSLARELPGGNADNESAVVIYGIIYLFYMLLIFNYVKL